MVKHRGCQVAKNRRGSHSVTRLTAHLVWVTKYRYPVLTGDLQKRCRELIIQICDSEDVKIVKGVVSKDHVHMLIEYPPSKSISELVRRMKGRTSRLLQQEYPALKRRYWGKHFWAKGSESLSSVAQKRSCWIDVCSDYIRNATSKIKNSTCDRAENLRF